MVLVDIFNQAIQLCGSEAVLVTVDDVNKEARLCRATYDLARRACLQRQPWKFSVTRLLLDVDTTFTPPFGYTAQYLLPDDYIRVVTIDNIFNGPWTREGRYLLYSGGGQIQLRYVKDITTLELFDPLFIDSLIAELAARICYSITQSNDRLATITENAKMALRHAKRADAIEQYMVGIEAELFNDSRITRLFDVPGR